MRPVSQQYPFAKQSAAQTPSASTHTNKTHAAAYLAGVRKFRRCGRTFITFLAPNFSHSLFIVNSPLRRASRQGKPTGSHSPKNSTGICRSKPTQNTKYEQFLQIFCRYKKGDVLIPAGFSNDWGQIRLPVWTGEKSSLQSNDPVCAFRRHSCLRTIKNVTASQKSCVFLQKTENFPAFLHSRLSYRCQSE
jgi:hypothetical protein